MANSDINHGWTFDSLSSHLQKLHCPDYTWSSLGGHPFDSFTKAAVLVPLVIEGGQVHIWLTERSQNVRHDKGHVSFPGGMKDDTDMDAVETSLREAEEEIAMHRSQVTVISELLPRINIRGTLVSPIVGIVDVGFEPVPNAEVARVFRLPLDRFLSSDMHFMNSEHTTDSAYAHFFEDIIRGGPVHTWGLTASICIEVACGILQRETEFIYSDGVPLSPNDPFYYRRRSLYSYLRKFSDTESNIPSSKL